MPGAIAAFRAAHPDVALTLTEADPLSSFARLEAGELDVALVYEYDFVPLPANDAIELVHLLDDPISAILPRSHPAARQPTVRLRDLAGESWITSTSRSSCHSFVRRACNASGFDPEITMESDDHAVWQGVVAAGVGVALASELSLPTPHPDVAVRRIAPKPLKRRIFAAHRVGAARSPGVAALLAIVLDAAEARVPYAATA